MNQEENSYLVVVLPEVPVSTLARHVEGGETDVAVCGKHNEGKLCTTLRIGGGGRPSARSAQNSCGAKR